MATNLNRPLARVGQEQTNISPTKRSHERQVYAKICRAGYTGNPVSTVSYGCVLRVPGERPSVRAMARTLNPAASDWLSSYALQVEVSGTEFVFAFAHLTTSKVLHFRFEASMPI